MTAKNLLKEFGKVDINSTAFIATSEYMNSLGDNRFDTNKIGIFGTVLGVKGVVFLNYTCEEDIATHYFTIGDDRFFLNLKFDKILNDFAAKKLYMSINNIALEEL